MVGMEGLGEAVTGGLTARAVEPNTGESGQGGQHGQACLNCGTRVLRRYCPECGQAAHVHRTLGAFWHDIAHSVLHFEGKIWRTLPLLAWRPGELTRRYVEGERARFVSPMALFLFSVFLMFAVISATGGASWFGDTQTGNNFQQGLSENLAESEESIKELEEQRAVAASAGKDTAPIDAKLKGAREQAAMLRTMKDKGVAEATLTHASDDLPSGLGWFDTAYRKAKANPSLLFYKVQTNAYKFSWALIPISVPFVWLLFLHRRRYRAHKLYDHTVFVTYSIAFMSLGAIVLILAKMIGSGPGVVGTAMMLVPPLHMYRQLRGAYRLSRWSAVWRTFALLVFASIASSIFISLLLALGVLG